MNRSILKRGKIEITDEIIKTLLPGLSRFAFGWIAQRDQGRMVYILRYEDMERNAERELREIMKFLKVPLNMKSIQSSIEGSAPGGTYKHKFRKGGWGNWQNELTDEQVHRCNNNFHDFLSYFSYI